MTAVVFVSLFALLTAAAFVTAFFLPKKNSVGDPVRGIAVVAGLVLGVITAIIFLSNSLYNVEARTVGVVTEFGKSTGTVNPGLNFLPLWANVTEFPTSTQPLDLDGTDESKESVSVKFDGGGRGWVNVDINWRVESNDKALALWNQWKEFDKVSGNVVKPRAVSATAQVVGVYAPLDAMNSSNNEKIAGDIKTKLNEELSRHGIVVDDVNIKSVDVDKETQARVDKQAAAAADIVTAQSNQERARIDNQTNMEKQASLTPGALVDKCLAVVDAWDVNKNGPLPAGFNCFTTGGLPLAVPVK